MTILTRRPRPHPARGARRLAGATSVAGLLLITGCMANARADEGDDGSSIGATDADDDLTFESIDDADVHVEPPATAATTEAPAATETPATTEAPASTETPLVTEAPVTTAVPATTPTRTRTRARAAAPAASAGTSSSGS